MWWARFLQTLVVVAVATGTAAGVAATGTVRLLLLLLLPPKLRPAERKEAQHPLPNNITRRSAYTRRRSVANARASRGVAVKRSATRRSRFR